jgi:iron transport multicopper oxidase
MFQRIAKMLLAAVLLFCPATQAAVVSYTMDVQGWVVDFQRPSILPRVAPHNIPVDARMSAILVNNSFPGPALEAYEGDTIEVVVINNLIDAQVSLDWDGVDVLKKPSTSILQQGGRAIYQLHARKSGTFGWRSSAVAQAASGLRGALIIRNPSDRFRSIAKQERVMLLSDARQRPEVCFDGHGSLIAGCSEIEKATLNGQWGDGCKGWPKPVVEVEKGQCYHMRFLALMSVAAHYFKVSIKDHSFQMMTGDDSKTVSELEIHPGQGVDAMLCATQSPIIFKDYEITYHYVGQKESKSFSAILRYGKTADMLKAPEPPRETLKETRIGTDDLGFDRSQCDRDVVFDLRDYIVDFLRPTVDLGGKASRLSPDKIPLNNRKQALLVNNSYPGPVLEAVEDDLICVTVLNNMHTDPAAIHWHGQHMKGYPAFDGVYGITQAAIPPTGGSFTYRWRANAGTHFYHGHMQALQPDKGLKGPIVVQAKNDPHKHLYDEERIISISDAWANPEVCLRAEGAQPGNPVCAEIDKTTWNGVWGDGSDEYPWPMVTVEQGKCYRLRFIGMMGQAQNFQIQIAGHNMTLIAVDGADVVPVQVSQFNLHAGERADIVVCADQDPGNYLISAVYDLATFLETAPAPKMPKVDSSKFWAFLNYAGHTEKPGHATKKWLGGYHAPSGTGGGVKPKAIAGFDWDTNTQSSWNKVKNLKPVPEPEKADITYVMDVGIAAPAYKAGITPYASSYPMYMFTNITTWKKPETPLLHTKGQCGVENVPYITVPENVSTVEVIINNLSPTAHVLHMHGMRFSVINYAPYSESWCSAAHFECFFIPLSVAKALDCKNARLGDARKEGPGSEYWGCPYDADKDVKSQNLENPLQKDMISLWRRSWAVIRFKVDNPGVWTFHCHMEQHIPTGQVMAFNLLPGKQPPIPKDVPTEGPCPIWSGRLAPERPPKQPDFFV